MPGNVNIPVFSQLTGNSRETILLLTATTAKQIETGAGGPRFYLPGVGWLDENPLVRQFKAGCL